jgi:hypothetical protein
MASFGGNFAFINSGKEMVTRLLHSAFSHLPFLPLLSCLYIYILCCEFIHRQTTKTLQCSKDKKKESTLLKDLGRFYLNKKSKQQQQKMSKAPDLFLAPVKFSKRKCYYLE